MYKIWITLYKNFLFVKYLNYLYLLTIIHKMLLETG